LRKEGAEELSVVMRGRSSESFFASDRESGI